MNYTPEDIDKMLSNGFDGTETVGEDVEVYTAYTGEDDPDVESFAGKGLKSLENSTKRFGIQIVNKSNSAKELVLDPGIFPTTRAALVFDDSGTLKYKKPGGYAVNAPAGSAANDIIVEYNNPAEIIAAGHSIDVVADDGIVWATSATEYLQTQATGPNARIRKFLEYIKKNPTVFAAIHIVANNTAMFETELRLRRVSPFKVYDEERIPFQDGFRPSNYNVEKIIVKRDFQLDGETLAVLTIPGQTTATLTFVAGATSSRAIALKRKLHIAKETGYKKQIFSMYPPAPHPFPHVFGRDNERPAPHLFHHGLGRATRK